MANALTKFICADQAAAEQARGELEGEGYDIIFGAEKVDFGTVDKTRMGGTNDPYAERWVVIGKKD